MEIVAQILYGSDNYGLNSEASDKDYKLIALPSFDDLYQQSVLQLPDGYDKENYSIMDIRKWIELLMKGNFNALEYLYSIDKKIFTCDMHEFVETAQNLFSNTNYIAYTWDNFYRAANGICHQTLIRVNDRAKAVSREYWIAELVRSIVTNDFSLKPDAFGKSDPVAREIRFSPHDEQYYQEKIAACSEMLTQANDYALSIRPTLKFDTSFFGSTFLDLHTIVKNMIKRNK